MKIFLTDDDEDDRLFFLEALTEIPLETNVKEFKDGVDLMSELKSESLAPDIIFLDLQMPLMNGFECLANIRNEKKFHTIPIIIYSTNFNNREILRLQEMGASRYLKKPSSYNQLKTLLYTCLRDMREKEMSKGDVTLDFVVPE